MLKNKLQDQEARITAVENNTHNIIVEAGAGTGKTTLLVKKMLFLFFVGKISLSKIIALTFTKKAAASLKQKLEEELHNAYKILDNFPFVLSAKDSEFAEQIKNYDEKQQEQFNKFRPLFVKSGFEQKKLLVYLKKAFEEISLCQIGTIHSFCLFILKKYAVEAGLNNDVIIDEGAITNIIFDKYWSSFLDEELNLTSSNKDIWLEILQEVSLADIKNFTYALCTPRFEDYDPRHNYKFLKEQSIKYITEAENLISNHPKKITLIKSLEEAIKALKQSISFYETGEITEQISEIPPNPTKNPEGWEKEEVISGEKIIAFANFSLIKNHLLLLKAFNLLKPFSIKVKQELLKRKYLSYDEIIFKTHHLLLTNKEVRQELKLAYDSIFIDEFQDTDPIQGEIMLFLAETFETFATNWQDLKLTNGKLFIVGDPKQSIYHFRGADISAYQKFCELLQKQGARVCILQNNFRSSEEIIDYVNAFGTKQIKFQENIQTDYQKIYNSKTFNKSEVELYLHDLEEKAKSEDVAEISAKTIAKWICDNVNKVKKTNGTLLAYKDIALLLPKTTDLNFFLNAFKESNIPYNIEEDKNFYSAQEILDLINILKVLKNPQDKISLLGILRSPIGLIPDDILLQLSIADGLDIYAQVQNTKVKKIYDKLKDLRAKTAFSNPIQIINETISTFNFIPYQALATANEQAVANIQKFTQIAEQLFENGSYTLEQLLDNLDTYQRETDKESSAILAEENFNVVKILSIHKAKGLEYPVVILTSLSKDFTKNNSKDNKIAFYSRSLGLKGIDLGNIKDPVAYIIKENRKLHEFEEKKRLLYVAMTRAKEKLIIIDKAETADKTFSKLLQESGCWPTEKREENLVSAKVFYQNTALPEQTFNSQNNYNKEHLDFNFQLWKKHLENREKEYKIYLQNAEKSNIGNTTIFQTPAVEHAIKVGSLCHKILQNIFSKTPSSLEYETDKEALKEAQTIVSDFCKTSAFEELKNMECLATELPFTVLENGVVKNGIVDALFKTKDGKFTLIDFKSDKIEVVNAKTVEPKYLEQLAFYKSALSKVFQGKIETSLVYLRPAKIYKIEE